MAVSKPLFADAAYLHRDYQRLFILIGTTSVFTSTQNVGTNAMCCISQLCIYVLYRLLSAILRNVRYQIQRVD